MAAEKVYVWKMKTTKAYTHHLGQLEFGPGSFNLEPVALMRSFSPPWEKYKQYLSFPNRSQGHTKTVFYQSYLWGSNEFILSTYRGKGEGLRARSWMTLERQ